MLIKIEVLTSGKTFKNYKVLCRELGLEVKRSGDSRKAQFKELERYCTYSKVGHSIIIEEVFEQPLQKMKRQGNNTVYSELLQLWYVNTKLDRFFKVFKFIINRAYITKCSMNSYMIKPMDIVM